MKQADHTSGIPGVSWHKRQNKWQVRFTREQVTYFLGFFDNLEDAISTRRKAENGEIPLTKRKEKKNTSENHGEKTPRKSADSTPKMPKKVAQIQLGHAYEGLTPLKLYWDSSYTPPQWMAVCRCECSREVNVRAKDIGKVKSCGCRKPGQSKALTEWSKAHNTSGATGVSWNKRRNKWEVTIKCKGVKYYLGRYDEFNLAKSIREEAEAHRGDMDVWYQSFVQSHGIEKTTVPTRVYQPRKQNRGGRHGKIWTLRRPDGKTISVKNLSEWCTKNHAIFGMSQGAIYQAFITMAGQLRRGENQTPLLGWTLEKIPEYQNKDSDTQLNQE